MAELTFFIFFTIQEMVTPTVQMGLPVLINVTKVIPHVHSNNDIPGDSVMSN